MSGSAFAALRGDEDAGQGGIAAGALRALDGDQHKALFTRLRDKMSEREALRMLLLSPYRTATWALVDQLSAQAHSSYWRDVVPENVFEAPDQNNESIRRLLGAKRPRAAFAAVHFKLDEVRPELLVQMLSDMPKEGHDKEGE